MPLGSKLGGEITERKISKGENTDKGYLTPKTGKLYIQEGRFRQEIDQDTELHKMHDASAR